MYTHTKLLAENTVNRRFNQSQVNQKTAQLESIHPVEVQLKFNHHVYGSHRVKSPYRIQLLCRFSDKKSIVLIFLINNVWLTRWDVIDNVRLIQNAAFF